MKRPPGIRRDRKRGTWYFVIEREPEETGKRHQEWSRGWPTMEAAIDARAKRLAERVVAPIDDTVEAFAKSWIAALPAEGIEAATVKHYRESIDRLYPTVGSIELQRLTGLDLDRAYAALLDAKRSARTVRGSHVAVRKMLAEAVRLGKVATNVANDARPPRAKAARARTFPTWTLAELERFLTAVTEHEHADLWRFAAFTGMRAGELLALRWADVDLDGGHVLVCRSIGRGDEGYYEKAPKSDAGRRTVELDDELVDLLRRHRKEQNERRLALGAGWRDLDLVFCEIDGSGIRGTRCSRRWHDLVERTAKVTQVPVIRFHDLRHSHCTQLLDARVRPDVVTERLGHASVAFTLQRYGHRYAGDQRSGLARLRAAAR
jgi:integrase